jgi:hypothetical protein
MLLALGALILICFGFLAYLKYVGIPMTRLIIFTIRPYWHLRRGTKKRLFIYAGFFKGLENRIGGN